MAFQETTQPKLLAVLESLERRFSKIEAIVYAGKGVSDRRSSVRPEDREVALDLLGDQGAPQRDSGSIRIEKTLQDLGALQRHGSTLQNRGSVQPMAEKRAGAPAAGTAEAAVEERAQKIAEGIEGTAMSGGGEPQAATPQRVMRMSDVQAKTDSYSDDVRFLIHFNTDLMKENLSLRSRFDKLLAMYLSNGISLRK